MQSVLPSSPNRPLLSLIKIMYELSLANALRFLSVDMIRQANSGHPGAPLGMAEMATVLWNRHLKHNPRNPHFVNRDRFVLSKGHA